MCSILALQVIWGCYYIRLWSSIYPSNQSMWCWKFIPWHSVQVQTKSSGLPTEWPEVFRVDSHAAVVAIDSQQRAGPHLPPLTWGCPLGASKYGHKLFNCSTVETLVQSLVADASNGVWVKWGLLTDEWNPCMDPFLESYSYAVCILFW